MNRKTGVNRQDIFSAGLRLFVLLLRFYTIWNETCVKKIRHADIFCELKERAALLLGTVSH